MKNHLNTLFLLTILILATAQAHAATPEELSAAKRERKELCMSVPACRQALELKATEKRTKELAKIRLEIQKLKTNREN